MVAENPTWGAPRIHGELLKLGFHLSEITVSRWLRRLPRPPDPGQRWLTFLRSHREAIAAMDFFTVPTLTFGVLYCFFVISHDRRKILCFNVTRNPHALWIVQQLREAWPYGPARRFLCSITTQSSELMWFRVRKTWEANLSALPFSQSLAERCRGVLGGELPTRLAEPRDRPE